MFIIKLGFEIEINLSVWKFSKSGVLLLHFVDDFNMIFDYVLPFCFCIENDGLGIKNRKKYFEIESNVKKSE